MSDPIVVGPTIPMQIVDEGWNTFLPIILQGINDSRNLLQEFYKFMEKSGDRVSEIWEPPSDLELYRHMVTRPEEPDLEEDIGDVGKLDMPVFEAIYTPALQSVPSFTAVAPTLTFPAKPGRFSDATPDEPTLQTPDTTFPAAPTYANVNIPAYSPPAYPTLPTLRVITIPQTPSIVVPAALSSKPSTSVNRLTAEFSYTPPVYDDTLFKVLYAALVNLLSGGTDWLNSTLRLKFDQGRAQQDLLAVQSYRDTNQAFAARGDRAPSGQWQAAQNAVTVAGLAAKSALNQQITIWLAEETLKNIRFAVEQMTTLEGILRNAFSQEAQRALEAARATLEAAIATQNAEIAYANWQLADWIQEAEGQKIEIEKAKLVLEQYREVLQGKQIEGSLNEQDIKLYEAQYRGVEAAIQSYNAQLQGVEIIQRQNVALSQRYQTQVETTAKKIEAISGLNRDNTQLFATKMQGYVAKSEVNKNLWDAWGKELDAEATKVRIFESQASAYRAQVEGVAAGNEARMAPERLKVEINKSKVSLVEAAAEALKLELEKASRLITAKTEIYRAKVSMYEADQSSETARLNAQAESKRLSMTNVQAKSANHLETARVNIAQVQSYLNTALEALKGAAVVQAQIGSGLASAVQLQASVSSSTSTNYSY